MLGNPVVGYIRGRQEAASPGEFKVTSTFAEHVASGRGPGVDLGNGRCGDPVFAEHDGKVTLAGLIGAAKVVRISWTQHPEFESGYAHLDTIGVKLNQLVRRGQQIGTLGTTGATACHLHIGLKKNGVEVDSWPQLDQVIAEQAHIAAAVTAAVAGCKKELATTKADLTGANGRLASIAKIATG